MAISYDRRHGEGAGDRGPGPSQHRGVQKMGGASGLAEVLSVILEKGIVIDAWVRVSIIGIEILTIEARVVVASVDTYLRYAEAIGLTTLAAAPRRSESIGPIPGLPGLPALGGIADDEVLAYLEAHPDGVRLSELQAYFGADRAELDAILSRLVQESAAVVDPAHGVYRPGSVLLPAAP